MLKPVKQPFHGASSLPLVSTLVATVTDAIDLIKLAAMKLQYPYGSSATLPAGLIVKMVSEGGVTKLDLATGSNTAMAVTADSYSDYSQSGQMSFFWLQDGLEADVQGNYDIGQTYTVNALLTYIPSGANQGKLTVATAYTTQEIVAQVVTPPANAANNDIMRVKFVRQVEGA
jgi:hypothetical protein